MTVEHAALLRRHIYINSFVTDISLIYSKINYCRSKFGAIKRLITCRLLGLLSLDRNILSVWRFLNFIKKLLLTGNIEPRISNIRPSIRQAENQGVNSWVVPPGSFRPLKVTAKLMIWFPASQRLICIQPEVMKLPGKDSCTILLSLYLINFGLHVFKL